MDDSYERYRETLSYHRQGKGYTESENESSYSAYEGPRAKQEKIVYVNSSGSQRHARSSTGEGSIISVSVKSRGPRKLRVESESRSSAEEVRVVRSILRESPRSRSRSGPYRHRYRSETRSEGSVRFDIPPKRKHRKYRVLNYDGASGPYEEMIRNPMPNHSYSTEAVYDDTRDGRSEGYSSKISRDEKVYRAEPYREQKRRQSPLSRNRIAVSENARYVARKSDFESLAFMTGSRGRSLSSERRSLRRDDPRPRHRQHRRRSTSRSNYRYSTSSEESSANYIPRELLSFVPQDKVC